MTTGTEDTRAAGTGMTREEPGVGPGVTPDEPGGTAAWAGPPAGRGPAERLGAVALARRSWRQLTSMRTALVLLFLLAVAATPGSLLPQRNVNAENVSAYLRSHGELGRWYDRLWLFDVFSSPWFSAIYLLLFVSLVGCLVPRLRDHVTALLRVPPAAPRRLDRLPAYAGGPLAGADPETLAAVLRRRRFRVAVRGTTVSGEKGYLKETGNLLFHFALLGLLVGVALGSWYGWHAGRLVVAGPDGAFCNTLSQYDDFGLGSRVGGGDLPPFCVQLDRFQVSYLDNGQPTAFTATVTYTEGSGPARTRRVEVNHPLRLHGGNVYLIGHGYATVIRYTDRYGRGQTTTAPFLPADSMLTSQGVAAFPDANVNPATGQRDTGGQVAFQGVYLPTVPPDPSAGGSLHPEERDPRLMLVAYAGNLGMDVGVARSVYTLDQRQIETGRLVPVGEPHMLRPGESWRLPDGSTVDFVGTRPWVTFAVRHDPGEQIALVAAVLLLVGLLTSLIGRRRRIWFRVGDGVVEAGGLPRTDYAGFDAEFREVVREAGMAGEAGPAGERGPAGQRRAGQEQEGGR